MILLEIVEMRENVTVGNPKIYGTLKMFQQ